MPDLEPESQPHMPGHSNQLKDTDGWGIILTLMVMGMLLICFVFRRRLMRIWRGVMET